MKQTATNGARIRIITGPTGNIRSSILIISELNSLHRGGVHLVGVYRAERLNVRFLAILFNLIDNIQQKWQLLQIKVFPSSRTIPFNAHACMRFLVSAV